MTPRYDRLRQFLARLSRSWVAFLAVGLVVGLLVSPYAFTAVSSSPGTVAVVPLEGGINGATASSVSARLSEARNDPDIDAVVLVSNSPGGGAAASETMYLEVARTADQMPVVASVDASAASGAYYAIAPTDYIFAKPSSLVGSVGVFTQAPTQPEPIDLIVASGPQKLSAGSERDWDYKTESLRRAFVGAVFENRGENLTISRAELSEANLYTGAQAVRNGMADEIGGTSAAVREAARRAGLDDYTVETLRPRASPVFVSRTNYVASDAPNKTLVSPRQFVGTLGEDPAMPNIVMMPPSVVSAARDDARAARQRDGTATPAPDGSSSGEEATP